VPSSSLLCPVHAHRSSSCTVGAPPLSTRGSTAPRRSPSVSKFALEVSNLPMPLICQLSHQSPRNCSLELATSPRNLFHRSLRSLAPPCQFCAHGCVRRDVLNVSCPFPKPPEPRRGRSACLRRTPAAGPRGTTAPKSAPLPLDLDRPPEIGWFRLNPSGSDCSPRIQIQLSLLSPPHPRLCPWALRSARPISLEP
jgi:hypothetical protein